MAFRLPRLPRNAALIDKGGFPLLEFQRWWQSVVKQMEDQLADITAAQQSIADLEVIPPTRAPLTAEANDLSPPAIVIQQADDLLYPPRYGAN